MERPTPIEPVRRAEVQDADVVARLLRDFNAEYDDPAPPQAEMAERIRVLLAHGDTIILLAGEPPCGLSVTRLRPGACGPGGRARPAASAAPRSRPRSGA